MRRRTWIIAIAIAMIPVVADTAYWLFAVHTVRTGYEDWRAQRIAQGWQIASGPLSFGGWPRSATVDVANLTLGHAGLDPPGTIQAAATEVTLSVSLFNPANLWISVIGSLQVHIAGVSAIVVSSGQDTISVPLHPAGPTLVDAHAINLRIEPSDGTWQAVAGLVNAQATFTDGASQGQSQPVVTFVVNTEAIALPAGVKWPLGANISSVSMNGALSGPLPVAPDMRAAAAAWRDGGGSLAITHFAMGWGPLGLTSTATLTLDNELQPMGSGNSRIVGFAPTLDRLAAGAVLSRPAATAAKALLSLMAGSAEADTPGAVDVPLVLRSHTISMGQLPLVTLPQLDWAAY